MAKENGLKRMAAKYIFTVLAAFFLLAGIFRYSKDQYHLSPASRTWLLMALIFALASTWLWLKTTI